LLDEVSSATVAFDNVTVFSKLTVAFAKSASNAELSVTAFLVKLITPEVSVTAAVVAADRVTDVPVMPVTTVPEVMPVPETTAPTRMCAFAVSMVNAVEPEAATPRELSASVTAVFESAAVVLFDKVIVDDPFVAVT